MCCSRILSTAGATPFRPAWSSSAAPLAAALLLAGCPLFEGAAPPATFEGRVLYAGRAAPGKVVSLLVFQGSAPAEAKGPDGKPLRVATDLNGVYRFGGLPAGTYQAIYVSQAVPDGNKIRRDPNEVGIWRTRSRGVSASGGARAPDFDVSYNGLIYPTTGIAYIVTRELPLPFHWSTHALGQRYWLKIYNNRNGVGKPLFQSQPESQPTALFQQAINSGVYSWEVAIDGGDAGEGNSLVREVDMGPPNQTPEPGEPGEPGEPEPPPG